MATMRAVHPALRYDLQVYATSDRLGSSIILHVSAPVAAAEFAAVPDLFEALTKAGEHATAAALLKRAGDWRLMTAEEVTEFRGSRP